VLDVYEHYRWRWRIQQPIRDKFQELLKHKKKGESSAALWQLAVKEVGPTVIQSAWHELETDDGWQDYYEDHKDLLASEVNFWSPFGGVSLSEDAAPLSRPGRPDRRGARP
jgi:hypothetical protein